MNKNKKIIAKSNINNTKLPQCNINKQNVEDINIKNNYQINIEEKFKELESKRNETFLEINPDISKNPNLLEYDAFLYHGIRFQNHLEKLEQIFASGAILAGNYHKHYYDYDDNCNDGEYISLLSLDSYHNLEYKTFIMPNISLVISPRCNPLKTIYVPFEEWVEIKKMTPKNRYSYARGEYQVKEKITLDMIKAIGLPKRYLTIMCQEHLIEPYINDILELMSKYNIELPIVDTSNHNRPIINNENTLETSSKKRVLIRTNNKE